MPETIRSYETVNAYLADNTSGNISASDMRALLALVTPTMGSVRASASGTTTGSIASFTDLVCTSALAYPNTTGDFTATSGVLGLTFDSTDYDMAGESAGFPALFIANVTFTTGANNNQNLTFRIDPNQSGDNDFTVVNGTGTVETSVTLVSLYRLFTNDSVSVKVKNNTSGSNHVTLERGSISVIRLPFID